MKTWKSALIGLVAIIAFSFGFIGCKDGDDKTHTHDWGDFIQTTAPTCTEAGIETKTCKLDPSHTETRTGANALGHNWEWIETSIGVETKICSRCNETDGLRLTLNIGDTGTGGGKIFYRSETGFTMTDTGETCHYLEAAPNDTDWLMYLSSNDFYNEDLLAGLAEAIGTGRNNTSFILTIDENAALAKFCSNYSNDGKTDWFLPSRQELQQLYNNRDYFDNLELEGNNSMYYTSSMFLQVGSVWIYGMWFNTGVMQGNGFTWILNGVGQKSRAIRAF
jgi:hypothetical protein